MKHSEERILRYLSQVGQKDGYARMLSTKLNIDYSYLIGLLHAMVEKRWIERIERGRNVFYKLSTHTPELNNDS